MNKTNYFLNFENQIIRDRIYKIILKQNPKNLQSIFQSNNPKKWLFESGFTEQWVNREISNFQYLMKLNTLAGRTYNDLAQYPVFPWVISNYTSKEIDLNDKKNYRDLSKPIGCQLSKYAKELSDKYRIMEQSQMDIHPFHYGSHYSTPGTTSYFLLRLEPFTTINRNIHNGQFDQPDRIFHSINIAWNNSLQLGFHPMELIPEFYYLPEMFLNINDLMLGQTQKKMNISQVQLPPWAKGSVHEFVRIMNEALESEYVSENLHHWIDLIFGYQQQGEEAIKAKNVFHPYTYQNNINFNDFDDEIEKKSLESQIENFGQCPLQILNKPHPQRKKIPNSSYKENNNNKTNNKIYLIKNKSQVFMVNISEHPIVHLSIKTLQETNNTLNGFLNEIITVDRKRNIAIHSCGIQIFNFEQESTNKFNPIFRRRKGQKMTNLANEKQINLKNCFSIIHPYDIIISCGYFDSAFRLIKMHQPNQLKTIRFHKNVVTCIKVDQKCKFLATGSKDSTVCIWSIKPQRIKKGNRDRNNSGEDDSKNGNHVFNNNREVEYKAFPKIKLISILYEHNSSIKCLDLNSDFDLIVSVSEDDQIIFNTLHNGKFIRSINLSSNTQLKNKNKQTISFVKILNNAQILIATQSFLYLYSMNGFFLVLKKTPKPINDCVLTPDHKFLITAGENGSLQVRNIINLNIIHDLFFSDSTINCLKLVNKDKYLYIGFKDGKIAILSF